MPKNPLAVRRARPPSADKLLKSILRKNFAPVVTGARQGTRTSKDPWLVPSATWRGTLPEWAIYWAHLQLKLKENEDFTYQFQFSLAPNGVDFFELDLQIAIEIQGLYWHYGLGAAKQDSDLERKARIEAFGIQVVGIDEDDALRDPLYYLKEARVGHDHSRGTMGGL
jgi:very-short-patch-repair endonuclease